MEGPLGMKKELARLTYPLREKMRLGRRRVASSTPPTDHLERDIRRLQIGWNQHIPRILEAISLSEHDAKTSDEVHARIDALRRDLDSLSDRVNANFLDIEKRLTRLEISPSNEQ